MLSKLGAINYDKGRCVTARIIGSSFYVLCHFCPFEWQGLCFVTEHTVMAEEQAADYDQVVQDLTGLLANEAVPVTVVDFQRKDASKQMFLDLVTC